MLKNTLRVFVLLIVTFAAKTAADTKGVVNLDSFTFDKVMGKFPFTLVKFDMPYAYGEKQDEFVKIADVARTVPELLIAEVGIKDYGEKENADLATRFGVKKDDFPHLKLFIQGKEEPITYTLGDFKADDIKRFIKTNSGLYIGLSSCIKEFDEYANDFMKSDNDKRKEILKRSKVAAKSLAEVHQQKSADAYVKIMRKIVDNGDAFVEKEWERVDKIQQGKITKEKKAEMLSKLNILQSFRTRDEL